MRTPALILVCLFFLAAAAAAQELRVPSQYPTIKAAIAAATPGSTVLVADGVYTGSGNVGLSFAGKSITVRSENGPAACILDAAHSVTIFTFSTDEGPASVLQGFTLREGNGVEGGGVKCVAASPTIRDCVFERCWASYHSSGVGCLNGSMPRIENCTFADGLAGVGGAVYSLSGSHPKLVRCTIRGHRTDLFGAGGSGCDAASSLTVDRCTFENNQATGFSPYGGALHIGGTATITNSLFVGNTAFASGGAIACSGSGSVNIVNCTFTLNNANSGGGAVWSQGGTPKVVGSILWLNSPDDVMGTASVRYSDVTAGYPGPGNISADPQFMNPGAGDYRLSPGGPCIDAGDTPSIPAGIILDHRGEPRRRDDPGTPDTGLGPPPVVDIGALEFQPAACYPDCNGDQQLNLADFGCFTTRFALGEPYADCNGDGARNLADFACFTTKFALGCP